MAVHRQRRTPRIRRESAPGAMPGTILVPRDAVTPRITLIKFHDKTFETRELESVAELPRHLEDGQKVWVNVDGLGDATTIEELGRIFHLHPLALEDAVNVHQRAKIEDYTSHLFVVLRMVRLDEHLQSEQVSLFLGDNFVVTLQEEVGDCLDPVRDRLKHSRGRIRQLGCDYLAYTIIDAVIDTYFPVVDAYGERLEDLDDEILQGRSKPMAAILHEIRHDLLMLRRAVRPLRDELSRLLPNRTNLVSAETQFYFRDCYDHTVQLLDLLDTYREMCVEIREFQLSMVNNRMNEVVKVLTVISTIFIPLSFVTGLYGMNFDTRYPANMPELEWRFGYPLALAIMTLVAGSQLVFFWRKGWIGRGGRDVP